MTNRWWQSENSNRFFFSLGLKNHCRWWLQPWKESYDKTRQNIKKQRHYFANNGPFGQSCGFPSNHVCMLELDHKEGWVPKNWCFWTVVLEKTLESPLGCKEVQPVRPKGDQSWVFIGRTEVEDETPILWPPDVKNWSTGKDPDAGKGWRQEGKHVTEDEMASSTQWTWVWVKLQEIVKDREPWLVAIHGISKCQTW